MMHEPRNPRYESLDLWRGVACLAVVVFHSTFHVATQDLDNFVKDAPSASLATWLVWITSRFWVGVPVFFVISGYCIAASSDSHLRKGHASTRFFTKRFARIFPPLWIFLLVSLPTIGFVDVIWPRIFSSGEHAILRPWWFSIGDWVGTFTLTQTWLKNFVDGRAPLLGHIWTLCYEEQFYFVCGVLLMLPRRFFFWALAAVTFPVALIYFAQVQLPVEGFFFNGLWLQFAAGVAVYLAVNYATLPQRVLIAVVLLVAFLSQMTDFYALVAFIKTNNPSYGVAFGFAFLLIVIHPLDKRLASAGWARPIAACGVMCYSLYLIHWPIVKLISHAFFLSGVTSPLATLCVVVPICVAASIAVSIPFHVYVERRFMSSSTSLKANRLMREEEEGEPIPATV